MEVRVGTLWGAEGRSREADWVQEGSGKAGSPGPSRGEHTWRFRASLCLRGPRLHTLLPTFLFRCVYGQAVTPGL